VFEASCVKIRIYGICKFSLMFLIICYQGVISPVWYIANENDFINFAVETCSINQVQQELLSPKFTRSANPTLLYLKKARENIMGNLSKLHSFPCAFLRASENTIASAC